MGGILIMQFIFMFFGFLGFIFGEFDTKTVIFVIGCFIVAAIYEVAAQIKIINRDKNKWNY